MCCTRTKAVMSEQLEEEGERRKRKETKWCKRRSNKKVKIQKRLSNKRGGRGGGNNFIRKP